MTILGATTILPHHHHGLTICFGWEQCRECNDEGCGCNSERRHDCFPQGGDCESDGKCNDCCKFTYFYTADRSTEELRFDLVPIVLALVSIDIPQDLCSQTDSKQWFFDAALCKVDTALGLQLRAPPAA